MKKSVDFYFCPSCKINVETQKCPCCGKKGVPVNLPFERDSSKDSSYLEYLMKRTNKKKLDDYNS